MAYDAGAAVGYLQLDITNWTNNLKTAQNSLTRFTVNFRARMRQMQLEAGRLGAAMQMATISPITRISSPATTTAVPGGIAIATPSGVAGAAPIVGGVTSAASQRITASQLTNEALARKAQVLESISAIKQVENAAATANTASIVSLKSRVAQEKAIAVDAARAQSRATLMEAQHGYRLAEIAARQSAISQVSTFTRIRQAGVSAFNSIGTSMTRLRYGAQLVATTLVVAFGLVAWQLSKLLGGFAEFEQRMRKATSVTKYTEDEFRAMTAEAETAAKKWGTPARDAADAFLFLGRAGLTASQQLAAMPAITAASKAMLEGLEETAEGTVNIMNAFNISFDKTPKVVDMMTEAVNTSTMNLHEFLVSLSYAAKPAAAFNNTMQDVAAMIGIAANAGIRGSKAGTALRYALTQLSSPTAGMKRLIRELHLQIYDATGAMIPFVDIIQQIQNKLAGASEQTRNYTLKTLFGQRALSTIIALFDKGAVGIKAYSDQIARAAGVTETTAQKQMRAMKSQLEMLRETWEALRRHIVQAFAPDVIRIIKVIISHVDDWTEAVDKNQKAVRDFVKGIVGMLTTFTKIVAGAAAFAILMRVLGGIVMILQAILSPLGLILVAIFAVQVGWEKNFLHMRDIGKAVFAELKEHAVDFFTTLIDGFWRAVTYGINQMARLTQWVNIQGMAKRMAKDVLTAFPKNIQVEGMRGNLIQALTAGGVTPEAGMEALLRRNRDLYEKMKYIYSGRATMELPEKEAVDFFSKVLPAIREAIDAEVEPAIRDILGVSTITTKTAIESLGNVFDAFKDKMKENIDWLTAAAMKMLPPGLLDPLLAALRELQDVWGDISSGKIIGESPTGLKLSYKEPPLRKIPIPGAYANFDFDAFYRAHASFAERLRFLYADFLAAYADDWNAAIGSVTDQFKTQIDVMADMFQAIQSDWTTALDNLMRQGSSFIDFMDSFFQAILNGFRKMVAEMLSIQMFEAVFGKGKQTRTTFEAGTGLWGALVGGLRYLATGKYETPSVSIPPSESLGQPRGFDLEDMIQSGGNSYERTPKVAPIPIKIPEVPEIRIPKIALDLPEMPDSRSREAPQVAFVIQNNTGMAVTAKQAAPPTFDGRRWVLNVVMEEAINNRRFGEIIANGA